ncbi:hypothetical protein H5410_033974 [Solanum commersonii]|uniref:Uncharacterized protein n=1 Tax=Solanum commersonii TaxID=4109 RepID=A0A9J5YU68_SOLCO|nr:hypothetical protein H5410_033974 [Solanum commersonii]
MDVITSTRSNGCRKELDKGILCMPPSCEREINWLLKNLFMQYGSKNA